MGRNIYNQALIPTMLQTLSRDTTRVHETRPIPLVDPLINLSDGFWDGLHEIIAHHSDKDVGVMLKYGRGEPCE